MSSYPDIELSLSNGARTEFNGAFLAPACDLHWLSPEEACTIAENLEFIITMGDRVTRQLDSAHGTARRL